MADSLAGIVLAAGAGTRLRPLTHLRPKPLCPVGDRPLLDHALASVAGATDAVAVNVHHGAAEMVEHLDLLQRRRRAERRRALRPPRVHVSHEVDRPLGTAGALGALVGWLEGRDALVVNADTWHLADLAGFAGRWDRRAVSVLTTTPGPFGPGSTVVASLLPGAVAAGLVAEPAGLWEVVWRHEVAAGRLVTVHTDDEAVDCGTPAAYLRANMAWARRFGPTGASGSVVGEGAVVDGTLERCVVWPGARVERSEHLVDAIRAGPLTVLVR